MTLLDRYIARQYLINIVVLIIILFSFIVIIDVSLNFDRLMNVSETRLKAGGIADPTVARTFLYTIYLAADLWGPRLLSLFNFMIGFVLVGAMGFTFSQLVRGREMVAVLASGIPLHRAAVPVLVVAALVTGAQALNQEFLVPRVADLLLRDHGDAGLRTLGTTDRVPLLPDAAGRLWYARSFDRAAGTLQDVSVWERDAGLASRRITAPLASWNQGGWDLHQGVATPRVGDTAHVAPEPIGRIETDLDPIALTMRRYESFSQALSWSQLRQMLARPDRLSDLRRERLERTFWGRGSMMAANLLSLVIAVPFFLRREPGNVIAQSVRSAPIALASLLGGVLGASAAIPGLPVPLGAFLPVLVLAPIALAQATSVKT